MLNLPTSPESLRLLAEENARRFGDSTKQQTEWAGIVERIKKLRTELLPPQIAVVKSKARRIAAFCTRQAGKSHVACQMMGEAAVKFPRTIVPYFALTKDQCHDIMWPKMKEWCERVGVNAHFNENTMRITFPNETIIRMIGVEKPKELDKIRGITPPLAVIDESGTFGAHIEGLVKSGLSAAMMRHQGRTVLLGTPGEVADGWFYRVTTGIESGWDVHKWSFLDNVHLPAEERNLDKIVNEQFSGDRSNPGYRREYLGEWVADSGSLVYTFDSPLNEFEGPLPTGHDWLYGLGVDLGSNDGTTFQVTAFSPSCETLYFVEEHKLYGTKSKTLSISEVADELTKLYQKYTFHKPVADAGALGKMIVEELNQRHGFALTRAEKNAKNDFIEHFNSDLRRGRIKFRKGSMTSGEMSRLTWDDKLSVTGKRREKPGASNDLCDAALYAFREAKHWAGKTVAVTQKPDGLSQIEWEWRQRLDKKLEEEENYGQDANWAWQ